MLPKIVEIGSAIISADTPSFSNLMLAINNRYIRLLIARIRFENDGVSAEIIAPPSSFSAVFAILYERFQNYFAAHLQKGQPLFLS